MKRILFILLIPIVLLQSFGALWISIGFYANRDFIAKTQCENRFVLNSSCNGQCVLMKKLKEQHEKEQQRPDFKLKEIVLFAQDADSTGIDIFSDYAEITDYALYPDQHYQFRLDQVIFHPPIA